MKEHGRFTVCMVLLAIIISSVNIIHVGGSSETQLKAAQDQSILFDITVLNEELVNSSIHSLDFDSVNNRLYVGTWQGLSIVEIDNLTVINITQGDGLVGYNIHALALDYNRQLVYIGFFGGYGISTYNWSSGELNSFYPENSPNVIGIHDLIYEPVSDCLFIGSDPDGLFIHNLTTNTTISRNSTHGLPSNQIRSLELDVDRNILYVGTHAGLAIYNIINDTFEIRTIDDGLVDYYVFNMKLDDASHVLYLGTWESCLSVYDINNDTFTNYDTGGKAIADFALDPVRNLLYVAAADSVIIFDTVRSEFINLTLTEANNIPVWAVSLYWDSTYDILFVGSDRNGLVICRLTNLHPPVLNDLPEHDYDGEYVVNWQPSVNATFYTLQESTEPSFSAPNIIYEGDSTFFVVSGKSDGIYYYRVRASNATSNSPWSEVRWIEVIHPPGIPQIQAISFPDIDGNYTVSWLSVSNAENYTLEEDNNSEFTSLIQLYSGTNVSFNVTDRPDGSFYYRVRAVNAAGNSSWSSMSVTVIHLPGVPVLYPLPTTSDNSSFEITWSPVSNGDYYVLEESGSSDFSSNNTVYTGPSTSVRISDKNDGTYYYRVKAVNLGGSSNWSVALQITVLLPPPAPIVMLSIIDDEYFISWTSIINADYYVVEEADNPEFNGAGQVSNGTNNSFITDKIGTHYYRVKAVNSAGESDWSNTITVSIPQPSSDPYFLPFVGSLLIIILLVTILIWQKFRKKKPATSEEEDA